MTYIKTDETILLERSKRYVYRIFLMRQTGTILCFLSIASVLHYLNSPFFVYILLGINAFCWPVVAYFYAKTTIDTVKTTNLSLVVDAALGGFWVALMAVSPFPALIMIAILISDRYAAGGWEVLKPSLVAMSVTFLAVWMALGFPLNLSFDAEMVWFSLPLATVYIMSLSMLTRNLAVQLISKNREFERIALMDPRLHIPNRRLFEQRLSSTFIQTQRNGTHAHLMLLDIDDFKHINDTYGHEAGDYFLAEISSILRHMIGPKDTPARFGGDELAIIVVDHTNDEILMLAQNISESIKKIRLQSAEQFFASISIGIASVETATTVSEWFGLADKALYYVKRNGRDGIQIY
ncbi:diguanylate cyclase [Acinetobacter sp. S40]|uniref:sensor domain-containing diguanylate cyclase n=1 Tax=Acinetobacter sp. S40 TaxID=2767434 RepID=UPI00190C1CDD|nr:sensor domain-containing diguanylate cyclase [Acinetobacter sp. S40]MBJ9984557.1 diguanylate cyclase [Acinetobacter sp. S40]